MELDFRSNALAWLTAAVIIALKCVADLAYSPQLIFRGNS
jgi:hypothetical protein